MHFGLGLTNKFIIIIVKIILLFKIKQHQIIKRSKIRKVLIYAYTGLGNFILYSPALIAIKNVFPNAKYTLLHGNDTGCHQVLKENFFDNYIVINRKANWFKRLYVIYQLRKEKYDLVISEFHNNNQFFALTTVLCGAIYRVGLISSPGWNNEWDFIYNIQVQMKKDQHEIDRYLELVYALSIKKNEIDKNTTFYLDEVDNQFALDFLKNNEIDFENERIISVQIGTSPTMRWKQWDPNKYIKLCDKIIDTYNNVSILFPGAPNEKTIIENAIDKMNNKKKVYLTAGKASIKQTAALIKNSDLLICNDSGLMHVAVAVDTPVIAIYGPTDYTRTAPLGNMHTIIRKGYDCSPCFKMDGRDKVVNCPYDYKCLKDITVNEVFEKVKDKLL